MTIRNPPPNNKRLNFIAEAWGQAPNARAVPSAIHAGVMKDSVALG
jgi:hypothetical protein